MTGHPYDWPDWVVIAIGAGLFALGAGLAALLGYLRERSL